MKILALLAALVAPNALACSCDVAPMTEQSARQADHAFVFQLLDARFISRKEGSAIINEGAHGSIRVVESIRGDGAQFQEITFDTGPCCGTRLDVGHYYVAFASGSGSSVVVDEGNVADVTDEYSEYSDYPRSEQGIITRVAALLKGTLSLEKAIPEILRSRVSWLGEPPQPPCPDSLAMPES